MNEPITKRLHVSGLTPALTPADLSARLSHFGTVKSLDGFGLPDGVGQPRKFGYVTLETTNGALKKCLSTLSGTTYKGAKLRIGEAKPDYTERFTKDPEPPAKKPRIHHNKFTGVQATDMTLITPENAATRPGWKVMPSGRVVRTMRMRPGKPLPPVPTDTKVSNTKEKERRRKKKAKDPDTRARSRTIDVTKWNGSYVTGVFLGENEVAKAVSIRPEVESSVTVERPKDNKDKRKEKEKPVRVEENIVPPTPKLPTVAPSKAAIASAASNLELTDLSHERDQTISFLNSFLFSSKGADTAPVDWDSDIELDEANVVEARNAHDADEGYEVVPRERQEDDGMDVDINADPESSSAVEEEEEVDEGESSSSESEADVEMKPTDEIPTTAKPLRPKNALKDLFAPREDEGGFSLLNHLELDLDDDLDLDMLPFPASESQTHYQAAVAPPTVPQPTLSTFRRQAQPLPLSQPTQTFTLDSKKPLFFPRPGSIAMFNVTSGASSSSPFYQHQTPEEIQKRWEENKLELTRGWKKRYREAGKVRRRRGGGLDD